MRRAFLICYDIRDERRLRRVFKVCKGFGEHWQYSIFFAVLKPIDRVRLQVELEEEMNLAEDQCLIIDLGENIEEARERACVIGQSLGRQPTGMVVV
jgi:CRISPR-associated protein Cas2